MPAPRVGVVSRGEARWMSRLQHELVHTIRSSFYLQQLSFVIKDRQHPMPDVDVAGVLVELAKA
jgi:hypothetical protein